MKNWIRIGGKYINLDQVVEITTDEIVTDYDGELIPAYTDEAGAWHPDRYPTGPCVTFRFATSETYDEYGGHGLATVKFLGKDRENILSWLDNVVEGQITNLNFADTGWK